LVDDNYLDLLRHVRQHRAGNVRELAQALGRDYKNVHQDMATFQAAGLLVRDGRKLTAPWDELQANVSLMAACGASKSLFWAVLRHQIDL